jgi:hypothetical protein
LGALSVLHSPACRVRDGCERVGITITSDALVPPDARRTGSSDSVSDAAARAGISTFEEWSYIVVSSSGSISDGSLFLTLPTRVLTGHMVMSSAG